MRYLIIHDSGINRYKYMSRKFLVGLPAHLRQVQHIKYMQIVENETGLSKLIL